MKKLVAIFIFIILFIFISICVMVGIDNNNVNDIKKEIYNNTKIENIIDVYTYDDKYLVMNDEYLYLLDSLYEEINKVSVDLLHSNDNNYDIVYRNDMIMYMDNYKDEYKLNFKYYDLYTYELIDEIVVGDD